MTTTTQSLTTRPAPLVLVTGGNRGLGRATVLAAAADGADVVLTYRSHADEAAAVVAEVAALGRTAVALPLDTSVPAGFPAFVDALRGTLAAAGRTHLDGLVNNAGSAHWALLEQTTEEALDAMYAVHVKGPLLLTRALLPVLSDGARVVNLSSGLTRFAKPGFGAYAAMKGAVEVLTRYAAAELAGRGITVNTVAPGPIGTDFGGGAVRDDAGMQAHLTAETALGRLGTPEEIGSLVATLLSPRTGWVSGQRIEASGGMLL